ncbi:hypothetical protein ADICEAN_03648 [Cesiribacter andamanensis AMV16]|uniref:Uncharacterized protein n=1 Tax=Cesiribacter andamanensis AMV16 TaxID=1279009 RepID=M7N1Q1_9BACT|nr:hypothetical protein ADICEAN_03648 [Cesiribacter andamanensis AMV16]
MLSCRRRAARKMSTSTPAEPSAAAPAVSQGSQSGARKAPTPRLPAISSSATPRLAPELMPSTKGPARGLRNRVCICRPATASPLPAATAVRALGRRKSSTMVCHIERSADALPPSMRKREEKGMCTAPRLRSARKSSSRPSTSSSRRQIQPWGIQRRGGADCIWGVNLRIPGRRAKPYSCGSCW